MIKKLTVIPLTTFLLLSFLNCSPPAQAQDASGDNDPHATGLILPTPEQEAAFKASHFKVIQIRPNQLALSRVNEHRRARGLPPLAEDLAAPRGREIVAVSGAGEAAIQSQAYELQSGDLPPVDNSKASHFPPIKTQGNLGSCACFATTYYQLTYTAGEAYEYDNKSSEAYSFSPKWTYDFINGGGNNGTTFADNFDVLERHGAAFWGAFLYDGTDCTSWPTESGTWQAAISYRTKPVLYIDNTDPQQLLPLIKQGLVAGKVLTFGTHVLCWQFTAIKNNPASSYDDSEVGKQAAYWVNGTQGGHAMTIVGYNDSIWVDINGNRKIDSGELGALRIANSWGDTWQDKGFTWLAYDALSAQSAVNRGPSQGRVPALATPAFLMEMKTTGAGQEYMPKVTAQFTISHNKRNQLLVYLGIGENGGSQPAITWYPGAIRLQGGPNPFSGSPVFDFSDILPAQSGTPSSYNYYLVVHDNAAGDVATLSSYQLAPGGGLGSPLSVDYGEARSIVPYVFSGQIPNAPPVAIMTATPPPDGYAIVTIAPGADVTFDGRGSAPMDDPIAEYRWDFGDGSVATGPGPLTYHYDYEGAYCATLTVADTGGASSSDGVVVNVTNPNAIKAPSGLAAAVVRRTVNLSWSDNSDNETGFSIERATVAPRALGYTEVGKVPANVTGFADSVGRGTYKYRVRAYNASTGVVSGYSNEVQVTVN